MTGDFFFNNKNLTKYLILDKDRSIMNYILYILNRTQSMFKWSGLPDTIPQFKLELYLQRDGTTIITEYDGKLYSFFGGLGGIPDEYYRPTEFIVSNPYLKLSKNYKIDVDCAFGYNDSMWIGLMPLITKYAILLTENDISMRTASINMRLVSLISCSDDKTKNAAIEYLREIEKGNLGVVTENAFLEGIKVLPTYVGSSASYLSQLTEYNQYLKASLYNDLGLQSNYNMKRENLNKNETEMDSDILLPLVDDMLNSRLLFADKVNNMYGTDIKVELNSSWKIRQDRLEQESELVDKELEDDNDETIIDTE